MPVDELLTKQLVIPEKILTNTKLTATSKLLLSTIIMASKGCDSCLYTNEDFAKLFNLDKRSISRYLSQLKKLGFIDMENKLKLAANDFMQYHIYCRSIYLTEQTKNLLKGGK